MSSSKSLMKCYSENLESYACQFDSLSKNKEPKNEPKKKGFGFVQESFSPGILNDMAHQGMIVECKNYVKNYFIRVINPIGVIYWNPANKSFTHYTNEEIKKQFIYAVKMDKEGAEFKFNPQAWFFGPNVPLYSKQTNH